MKRHLLAYAAWLLSLIGNGAWAEQYLAAAGRVDVTPALGAYLAGYGPDRQSTGVHDPLWAKALLVKDDLQALVIVTLDNIGLTRPDVLALREQIRTIVPGAYVVVSSTHTHAGPDVVGIWGPALWRSGRDPAYLEHLGASLNQLVSDLQEALVPVSLAVAADDIEFEWVENRSEKGLLDQRMTMLKLTDQAGQVIATLTNFACHPTVLGPDNTKVSADYVAGFYAGMAAQLDGEHLFLQGAIGGWVQPLQGNRSTLLARRFGGDVARHALRLMEDARTLAYQPLLYRSKEIDVPLENSGFRLLIALGVLERELHGGWLGWSAMRTEVSYFRLGELGFVTHPGETSPYYSLVSRQLAPDNYLMVMGLTQDAMGYILKPDYFAQPEQYPHADYLTSVSVGPDAGVMLMETIADLIQSAGTGN